jgi:hypothetical protein
MVFISMDYIYALKTAVLLILWLFLKMKINWFRFWIYGQKGETI